MSLSEAPDARLIERFAGVRVLVVGDAMLDEYVEGDADRICPEAPVPVVRVTRTGARPGGAANVAVNAVTAGATADLATVIGEDATGDRLLDLCREAGLGTALVVRSGHRETTRKARIIARGQQVLRVDWERTGPLGGPEIEALLEGLGAATRPDVLVVSDYAKGCLTSAVLQEVIARGRRWGVPVLVDPKSPDLERYRGATVVTPNRQELAAAVGGAAAAFEPDRIGEMARPLLGRFGLDHLVVTCGADGLVVVSPDASEVVPAARRQVADVTGAGDTVVAILALTLGAGGTLVQAARLANLAAGLVVERVGTAAVEPDELRRAVAAGHGGRVLSRVELRQRLGRWRAAGLRVVFTNGCFDLLHRGHLALLRAGRERGDVLVVGLNGDRSAARLKGPGRPIVPERTRAEMLAALDVVAAVVIFDEDTPLELIREIRPQVLVKGADYARDQVVGGDLVEGWGGEVMLVPLVPGHSTTGLLSQLRPDAAPPP